MTEQHHHSISPCTIAELKAITAKPLIICLLLLVGQGAIILQAEAQQISIYYWQWVGVSINAYATIILAMFRRFQLSPIMEEIRCYLVAVSLQEHRCNLTNQT